MEEIEVIKTSASRTKKTLLIRAGGGYTVLIGDKDMSDWVIYHNVGVNAPKLKTLKEAEEKFSKAVEHMHELE